MLRSLWYKGIIHHKDALTRYQMISSWSELKAFADDIINVDEKLKFGWRRVEKIVGIKENDGYQGFLLLPQCFLNLPFSEVLIVGIVW